MNELGGHRQAAQRMTTSASSKPREFATPQHLARPVDFLRPRIRQGPGSTTRGRPTNRTEIGTRKPRRCFTTYKDSGHRVVLGATILEQGKHRAGERKKVAPTSSRDRRDRRRDLQADRILFAVMEYMDNLLEKTLTEAQVKVKLTTLRGKVAQFLEEPTFLRSLSSPAEGNFLLEQREKRERARPSMTARTDAWGLPAQSTRHYARDGISQRSQ